MMLNMMVDSAMIDEKHSCEAYKGKIVTELTIIIIYLSILLPSIFSHSVEFYFMAVIIIPFSSSSSWRCSSICCS